VSTNHLSFVLESYLNAAKMADDRLWEYGYESHSSRLWLEREAAHWAELRGMGVKFGRKDCV